jgi:hypothetical protein
MEGLDAEALLRQVIHDMAVEVVFEAHRFCPFFFFSYFFLFSSS